MRWAAINNIFTSVYYCYLLQLIIDNLFIFSDIDLDEESIKMPFCSLKHNFSGEDRGDVTNMLIF